jgi:predicted MPP superfamily phosphohydrolase
VVLRLKPSSNVDLTIAGHTHGGQIALPLLGPVFTSTRLPRSVAAGGLHDVAGNPIFVSTGVGVARMDAPQVRLLTRPAVGLVVLR